MLRFNAEWNLARASWLNGELAAAERALAELAAALPPGRTLRLGVTWEHGQVLRAQGRLGAALADSRHALAAGLRAQGPALPGLGMAHLGVAAVLYERDELAAALEHATEGVAGCRQIPRVWSVTTNRSLAEVLVILAWIQRALGDHAAASAATVEAERAEPSPEVIGLFNPASAERMRLSLAQGQLAQVAEWAAARRLDPDDQPSYSREGEYLVLARLLIAQGEPERTLPLLARLHAAAAAQQRTGSLVEIGAVTARALAACGRETSAMAALAGTLTVAWPEGYVRVFADEGALLAAVLDRLITVSRGGLSSAPGVPPAYLRRLQTAFGPRDTRSLPSTPVPAAEVAAPVLTEPLTGRELQVLALLAAGIPNQQIASELVVALETVKKHVSHILGKLGAANRTQAVARARALGLLR